MKKTILAVLIAALLVLPMSALALEKMSGSELGGVVGQAGVTIAFCGTSTTTVDFSSLSWGDPDGTGPGCASNIGWLVIDGDITITQEIAGGESVTLDIATTGASTCTQCANVVIPPATTFIAVGLPDITTTVSFPDTLAIGLGTASATISGTLGLLRLTDLDVTTGNMGQIIIYAH